MRIQPDEGISLRFGAKVPSPNMAVCPVVMDFNYAAAFGVSSANGYERLLLDAMLGDATLFAHRDGVETMWALYTPILGNGLPTLPISPTIQRELGPKESINCLPGTDDNGISYKPATEEFLSQDSS